PSVRVPACSTCAAIEVRFSQLCFSLDRAPKSSKRKSPFFGAPYGSSGLGVGSAATLESSSSYSTWARACAVDKNGRNSRLQKSQAASLESEHPADQVISAHSYQLASGRQERRVRMHGERFQALSRNF